MTVETISIFSSRAITKNASTVLATPINMVQHNPDTEYYADITASGGGSITMTYQVGLTPSDTFFTPVTATALKIGMLSPPTSASREYSAITLLQAPWMKFKCKEANASPVVVDFNLIVAK